MYVHKIFKRNKNLFLFFVIFGTLYARNGVGILKYSSDLQEQIEETAYLTAENAFRYRPIMRFFYQKYEQAENWLYKEDVYNALKEHMPYTMEECQRDLEFLVSKKSLTTIQDTENANTLEKFKYKNFRYQMTDNAVEIERMTVRLEEIEVKVTSLESRLFERIRDLLKKLTDINNLSESDMYELWMDLTTDFNNLNQSYQDFLKKFNEPQTEELLQSISFIEFKKDLISYLENFIKKYIKYSKEIKDILVDINEETIKIFMDSLIAYQKKAPKIRPDFDFDYLRMVNMGKWSSLQKWFYSEHGESEGERLLKATNHIISKVTKYASNLIELHGNMIQRKEEYKHLIRLFDKTTSLDESSLLASSILGVGTVRHFKGLPNVISDSLIKSYDIPPIMIEIDAMRRGLKTVKERTPIKDKTAEKEQILEEFKKEEEKQRKILEKFMEKKKWIFKNHQSLNKEERRFVLSLLDKLDHIDIENNVGKGIDPLFGLKYTVTFDLNSRCTIESEDGILTTEGITLEFEDDDYE